MVIHLEVVVFKRVYFRKKYLSAFERILPCPLEAFFLRLFAIYFVSFVSYLVLFC